MNNKSLVAKWISKCEEEMKLKCKNIICKECKYFDVCTNLIMLDTKFKIRGYNK